MIRTWTLGGVAVAVLSSGCCWRPLCSGPGPAMYNPPPAPLFPRLHPGYWAHPPAASPPAALPAAGPDCPGCVGGMPPGALPAGAFPMSSNPVTVTPPPGAVLSAGPQFSPTYFGPSPAAAYPTGSTQLPPPRTAGDPPATTPMK